MRKLGIILAVMVAATLGYSGTASAQSPDDFPTDTPVHDACKTVTGDAQWQDAKQIPAAGPIISNTVQGDSPADDPNEEGLQQTCSDNHLAHTLCGAADGIDEGLGEDAADLANGVRDLNEGLEPITGHPCPTGGDDTTNPPDDDDDDDDGPEVAAVQRSNATADGGLPRTGGELFAGAGLGLMSLGALVRRFLP